MSMPNTPTVNQATVFPRPEQGRLAIVAAMPQELQALLDHVQGAQCQHHAGRVFWLGQWQDRAVVLALSGIGKVAAATTAAVLAERFGAQALLFTGVAGGLAAHVAVGDVVLADALVQHDMDASPLFPRYELPGRGLTRLSADPGLTARLRVAAQDTLTPQSLASGGPLADTHLAELGLCQPRVHEGLVLSGDRFVASHAESAALRDAFPDALAVEMEGAAVAQVCHDLDLPFAVLRVISDRADQSAHLDFTRFIEQVARRYVLAITDACLGAVHRPAQYSCTSHHNGG